MQANLGLDRDQRVAGPIPDDDGHPLTSRLLASVVDVDPYLARNVRMGARELQRWSSLVIGASKPGPSAL